MEVALEESSISYLVIVLDRGLPGSRKPYCPAISNGTAIPCAARAFRDSSSHVGSGYTTASPHRNGDHPLDRHFHTGSSADRYAGTIHDQMQRH
jgi:hypothetical protein